MGKYSNLNYNKKLKHRSRKLRNESTMAEIRIWSELLRGRKMLGYPFLRERPVLHYIADFMCKPIKLIIEVDGFTHDDPKKWRRDKERQKDLENHGFCVIRFWDEEVMRDLENVARRIETIILDLVR